LKKTAILLGVFICLGAPVSGATENTGTTDDPGLKVRNCKFGPDTCLGGYVWRGATPADHVCVSPQARASTKADNESAGARRSPSGGAYGPDTCRPGFVWRGVSASDHVCVTPQTRSTVEADNRAAQSRKACV